MVEIDNTPEKMEMPYILSNASVEEDADGGKTYRFITNILETTEYTVYVSKDQSRVVEEAYIIKGKQRLKSYRHESLNGLKHGVQEEYDGIGRLECRIEYKNGFKDGKCEKYNIISGELEEKGQYKQGKKEGKWEYLSTVGESREISYLNGKYDGSYEVYMNLGGKRQLVERRFYVNGKLSGIRDKLLFGHTKITYVDGKKDGVYIEYQNKEPIVVGEYSKGKRTGEWTYYYSGKLVSKIEHYKDGKRHGICKDCYYRFSKQVGLEIDYVMETNYIDGLRDGEFPYEELDEKGEPILKGILINKKKEGVWNHYQSNELVAQDFYIDGKLVSTIKSNIPAFHNESKVPEAPKEVLEARKIKMEQSGDWIYRYECIGDIKDGLYQTFDCNGRLFKEGYYSQNKKVGIWKMYDDEGNLFEEAPYVNGMVVGIIKRYLDGEVYERTFVAGKSEKEQCPFEKYFHGEITEQGECTIEQKCELVFANNEKVLQKFRYGKLVEDED